MQAEPKATTAGGATRDFGNGRPTWFTGRQVAPGVAHVMTFRSTWDLFQTGTPMGPWPGDIRPGAVGLIVPVPDFLTAADVDIYVSDGKPFWRDEHQARRDNACLGPLRNKADQYLTGVSTRRSTLAKPTPPQALAPTPKPGGKRVRGIGTAVDDEGVLWVVEQVMSPSDLGQE